MADSNLRRAADDKRGIPSNIYPQRSIPSTLDQQSTETRQPVPRVQTFHLPSPNHEPGSDSSASSFGHGSSHNIRDSGYNTDVSPATTSSPATTAPPRQHFVFDNIAHGDDDRAPHPSSAQPTPLSAFSDPRSPHAHVLNDSVPRGSPPLRLSPDIFRAQPTPGVRVCQISPRPASEASDTYRTQFDFESDDEADFRQKSYSAGNKLGIPGCKSHGPVRSRERYLDLSSVHSLESEDDENVFYSPGEHLNHLGVHASSQTTRGASSSAVRRRHFSTGEDSGEMGAWSLSCADPADETAGHRRRSLSESCSGKRIYAYNEHGFLGGEYWRHRQCHIQRDSALTCSQGFQPGYFDASRSVSCDSENVFTFDLDDIDDTDEAEEASGSHQKVSPAVPILREKPPQSPASRTRRRRVGICSSHVRTSSGLLLPCHGTIKGVSVSTQTPHQTSVLIDQLLSTPIALPNEAIGTAAGLLRRRSSESSAILGLPSGSAPLPDIVPTTGRDRSYSVPDFHTLERAARTRETGRQVGRELRRMSDDFNWSVLGPRRLSPVSEDFDGYPSSFPVTRPRGLLTRIWFAVQDTLVRRPIHRPDSSVDLTEHSTPDDESDDLADGRPTFD
ncbi:unnamed protein product [Lymnaea stagnalis]|uniref:Uncharacterized protein n=1 Tax=Lymnaea stagnalis TaxID=6523 RepID=A0AAV2H726_LYMST